MRITGVFCVLLSGQNSGQNLSASSPLSLHFTKQRIPGKIQHQEATFFVCLFLSSPPPPKSHTSRILYPLWQGSANMDDPSLSDSSFQNEMPAQVGFSDCFSVLDQETQEVLKRSAKWRQTCMPRADQVKGRPQFTPDQSPGSFLRTVITSESSWPVFKCQS